MNLPFSMSKRPKRGTVDLAALIVTMAIFLPLMEYPWAIYISACIGYSVLVFGMRWVNGFLETSTKPASSVLITHLAFLAVIVGWVWLCLFLKPHLPYFMRTEDTRRPYFGLALLGVLGMYGIEAVEQKWLATNPESDPAAPGNSTQR